MKELLADKLRVKVFESRKAMGQIAAQEVSQNIINLLVNKDEINMIFAAAPSQDDFLESLVKDSNIPWDKINAFHMDEYIGLSSEAPQSFANFLKDRIFSKVPFKSIHYINGNAKNIQEECERYALLLEKYPTDIVCMGIGENGHIAFNDPHVAEFDDNQKVKIVDLDEKCRKQQVNDGCFDSIDQVPTHAVTLTIPTLIKPTYVYCIVPGKTKGEAVYNTVKGEVTKTCPASILRIHENAILYTDMDSAKLVIK